MDADTIQSWCTSLVLRLGLFGLSFVAVVVTACRGPTDSTSGPDLLQVASGNSQSGTVNRQLAQRLSVKVTTSDGMPRAGIGITWSVTLHYDGAEWAGISSGTTEDLLGLTGASGHLFAVGKNATIVHYDGASWSVTRVPADIDLRGVWAASPRQVFAVGAQP